MSKPTLLMAFTRRNLASVLASSMKVDQVKDGRKLIASFTRMCRSNTPPVAVVLDLTLPIVGGKSSSMALRAIEDALGCGRVPIIFLSSEPKSGLLDRLINFLGDSYYLQYDRSWNEAQIAAAVLDNLQKVG